MAAVKGQSHSGHDAGAGPRGHDALPPVAALEHPRATLRDLGLGLHAFGRRPLILEFSPAGEPTTHTGEGLAREIEALGAGLAAGGLSPGESVVLCAPNSTRWVAACFGIIAAGGRLVPVDDQLMDEELAHILERARPARILTVSRRAGLAGRAVFIDDDADWQALHGDGPAPWPVPQPDDCASLLFTSGTTGVPKAVPLSHANFLANVRGLLAADLIRPDERAVLPLPLHHTYAFTVGLLALLARGALLILPASVSGPDVRHALVEGEATALIGVPRLYAALLDAIERRVAGQRAAARWLFGALLGLSTLGRRLTGRRLGRWLLTPLHRQFGPRLRTLASGGARLEPGIAAALENLGWEVLIGYGLTETSPVVSFNGRGASRLDSAGRPLAGVEVRVAPMPDAAHGEIQVRGPSVFAGYLDDPEANRAAFTEDGWFRTGDLGFVDADGFLHVEGRCKEVIVLPDGKNVMPEEVERVYAAHALIQDVAVLEHSGRLVGLVVPDEEAVKARGAVRQAGLLRDALEEQGLTMPAYRRLGAYRLTREALPRTRLGKLRRHELPALYAAAGAGRPAAPAAPSAEDRELLSDPQARRAWQWLERRFPDQLLALDTSPQLELGVDSLEWLTLTLELREQLGVTLDAEAVSRVLTLRDLVTEICRAPAATPAAEAEPQPPVRPPRGPLARAGGAVVLWLVRALVRLLFRLEVRGREQLPASGSFVVTPNHASYLDPLVLVAILPWAVLRRTAWAGWTGRMFTGPVSSAVSAWTNVFPVDPDRELGGGASAALAALARGEAVVWFPEGRRSPTGDVREFLPGVGTVISEARVPAVPVLIEGSFEAWPRHRLLPRPGSRLRVRFGAPLSLAALSGAAPGEPGPARIAEALRDAVLRLAGP